MVLSLPFILAFIGSAVALIVGMVIYGDISEAIECPVDEIIGGGGDSDARVSLISQTFDEEPIDVAGDFSGDVGYIGHFLFTFTNPPTLNDSTDMLFGFKIDGLSSGAFEFASFGSGETGGGTCYFNTAGSDSWNTCSVTALGLEIQLLVEDVTDFETTGGINPSALLIHHTFDSNTRFDSAIDDTLYVNAGTLGHDGDISVLNYEKHQDDFSTWVTAGKVGDGAVFVGDVGADANAELEIGFSENAVTEEWTFLHSELGNFGAVYGYSINLWLKGQWTDLFGTNFVPILSDLDTEPLFATDGMVLGINGTGEIFYKLATDIDSPFNEVTSTLGGLTDNTWSMVTIVVNQEPQPPFTNSELTIRIDATCQIVKNTGAFDKQFFIPNRLTIGNGLYMDDFISLNVFAEKIDFNIDQLCIWKDHQLIQSEINTLYNSGAGTTCGTVSGSGGGGGSEAQVGSEQCQQAKDISWTVIGIIPVALFFSLFAIFSALGTGRQ